MSENIKYLQHSEVARIKGDIQSNLSFYADSKQRGADVVRDCAIQSTKDTIMNVDLAKKIRIPTEKNSYDAHNSIQVYQSLPISPSHACDERIWVYLSHFDLRNYVSKRWPLPKNTEKQVKHIHAHYFVNGNRGLFRDNGVARLWWMGYIASRSQKFSDPEEVLNILFLQTDVRANFLERNLSMNRNIFDAVIALLQKDYKIAKNKNKIKSTLFERKRFRDFMKKLNRIGGYRMLDVFEYGQLCSEFESITKSRS